jgi:hypothetical protein
VDDIDSPGWVKDPRSNRIAITEPARHRSDSRCNEPAKQWGAASSRMDVDK